MNDEPNEQDRKSIDWPAMRDNQGELAAWMLQLIDESPDGLAIIEVPHSTVRTDAEVDAVEAVFIREFDRAKRDRPDMGAKLAPGNDEHPDAALLIAIHEHLWVGGRCIRGCGEQRDI